MSHSKNVSERRHEWLDDQSGASYSIKRGVATASYPTSTTDRDAVVTGFARFAEHLAARLDEDRELYDATQMVLDETRSQLADRDARIAELEELLRAALEVLPAENIVDRSRIRAALRPAGQEGEGADCPIYLSDTTSGVAHLCDCGGKP